MEAKNLLTVEIRLEKWWGEYVVWLDKFSQNTKEAYVRGVMAYHAWFVEEMDETLRPEKLFGPDVERWKKSPANENPNTFNLRLAALRELVKCGLAKGWLSFDPLKDVEGKAEQALAPHWLTKGERGKLLRQVAADVHVDAAMVRNQAAIHLMVYSGLRVGEVASLLWEDVVIRERSGFVTVRDGKGGKKRTVPLNVETRKALGEWQFQVLGNNADGKMSYDEAVDELKDYSVFGCDKRSIQRWVATAGLACGLEGLSAHYLRHTAAKTMLDAGVQLTVVAAILGHSSLETTRRYLTPGLDDLMDAVERI